MLLSWYSRSSIWHASIAPIAFRTWLGKFLDMMEKTHNNRKKESRQYTKDKTKKDNVQADISQKINIVILRRPLSNCLLCWVDHAVVRCYWRNGGLTDASRAPAWSLDVASSLYSTPMPGWCKAHSCSGLRKLKLRKPSMLVSGENKLSSVCDEFASIAGDTPGLFSPVPIAGDFGGVSSSSDLVTTAACRGDTSHSAAVLYFPARCSPITLSGCTEISGTERSIGNWYSDFKIIFNDAGNMPFGALLSLF